MVTVIFCRVCTSAAMTSGLINALIDGGITFDAWSVTTWNHSGLNPNFL